MFSSPGTEQISSSNDNFFPFSSSPLHLNTKLKKKEKADVEIAISKINRVQKHILANHYLKTLKKR